jgi:hypothetical protein
VNRGALVAALALALAGPAMGQTADPWTTSPAVGLGPLILKAQSPVALLRLSPTPLPPTTLAAGQWQVGAVVNWNNYFDVEPGRYLIDAETLGITGGLAYGITDALDVYASLPVSYRGGGILDRFIENFEASLAVANGLRKEYPRNQFLVRINGEDGVVRDRSDGASGWGMEDGTLGVRYQLRRGSDTTPAILLAFAVKLATGRQDSFRSTGGTDTMLGVSVAQRVGVFHLYGTAAVMHYSQPDFSGIRLEQTQWSLSLAGEFRASRRTSILVQALVTSATAVRFGDFAKNTYEITGGFKRLISRNVMLEASVLENLFVFDNSPDVGFHAGLVWRSDPPDSRQP